MATESPKQQGSDEATLTSAPEPTVTLDTDSQNVDLNRPHINDDAQASAADEFENKHISDVVDDLVNSTEVSISGGSDNEAARSDASKGKDHAKGHGRAASGVKKLASFKAVKVNKTFLNAKGSAPSAESKAEKAPPTVSAAAAPTGPPTGTRPRLVAKTGSGLITRSSGANGGKTGSAPDASAVWNKNRPAPPPEPKTYTDEELKKYGIHMATRLHPDDTKGQSNWADIEDDDEDWAPDTITWKDGTKIAITHTEDQPAPPPEPASRPTAKEPLGADRAKPPAAGTSPSVKPGVLASGKGLVLKGAQEKPTLVAKPPAPPTPAKSPWAPLPKIEKASPIAVEAPTHAGPKFPPKETPVQHANTPQPPKEIAADDFSRGPWRDGSTGGSRELFNSQSGRYEPVPDRRGPLRQERQAPLLQRPSHHEQHAPIEPPGALQAGRNNEQGPWERRRGSSNVSGGSGSWQRFRTMEHPPPPAELINARRASMTGGSDGRASPRNFSPSGLQGGPRHGQQWQHRASPGTTHAVLHHPGGPAPDGRGMPPPVQQPAVVPVTEEDYELQKRLMRERRELAMRRRQEEEAREEAARKERIRLKLEALGPAPESKSAKAAKEQSPIPTQIQTRDNTGPQKQGAAESQAAGKDVPAPAVPESVTHPTPHADEPRHPIPQPDGVEARPQPHGSSHGHSWAPTARQADRHPVVSWGHQPSTKNVWGAPNNNRTLGNGTFVTDLGTAPITQPPSQSGPGPIAPPSSARAASASQATVPEPAPRQPPIGPPRQAQASRGAGDREMKDNPWAAAVRLNDDKFSEMLNAQYNERDRRLQAEGRSLKDIQPAIRDTWRPVKLDESGVRKEVASKHTLHIGQENPWAANESKSAVLQHAPPAPSGTPSEYGQLPATTLATRDMTSTSVLGARGSRFFPSREARQDTNRDIRQEASTETLRHESPSPPPPDMPGHPAFDGDVTHPHVSLPRPQPVVRLPPSAANEPQASGPGANNARFGQPKSPRPSFSWAAQAAYKGPDNASRAPVQKPENAWQTRIDNLLGGRKVHAPPKPTPADAGNRVPNPSSGHFTHSDAEGSVTTKGMAEECFEEQEMGSVPPIRLPKTVPEMAWQPSPAPKPPHKRLQPIVSSADSITFNPDISGAGQVWRIRLPGQESSKALVMPFGRTRSNPRRGGQRGGRHSTAGPHRQGKGRDPASYPAEQSGNASGVNAPHGKHHRGGYRGRDNWSRSASTHIQT
ncbi:uncharacterized protein B0T15DRAFT_184510 [Chaetomium strumarium]|uniref:Uncharacterized protein n=1 Tax=Chaetomium strumarium TaxID=1170767 RepID=A0AAJ0GWV7_9PEZI|nr:hypothetical protein B0T15DRAFT_184510 [Chaetomium strumarium]